MDKIKRIVLGDDGMPATATARRAAIDLARHWNAALEIVLVAVGTPFEPASVGEITKLCERSNVDCSVTNLRGDASTELTRFAYLAGADLIILGSHSGADHRLFPGSVGRMLLSMAQTPVLIVRDGVWPPVRMIVGDDGSAEAQAAAELAADVGRAFGASALLVDALPETTDTGDDPVLIAVARKVMTKTAERLSHDAEGLRERLHGHAAAVISHEAPAVALRENAVDASEYGPVLIAVGSAGKTELERELGWSVSTRVADVMIASVLVVPKAWVEAVA